MGHTAGNETLRRVPAHLRQHVVQQDYGAYTAVDQAVWRFILLQLYDRLRHTAHPAYVEGLEGTGMAVDRIPRIEEMDAQLAELGWGAVCVDGFIPPRAFQEFQAQAILPIAAEIRRAEHLPYTPAPDIVHEAAGHAPILPDPTYARFLRRIGDLGTRAFTRPVDGEVYEAIYALSVAKEQRDSTPSRIADAEHALEDVLERCGPPSEAGRLARLYWWTVEYGLVGTPEDYRLYGAGLLSSLGESHTCHRDEVAKLPLDEGCVQVAYDITSRQPQLFVARDFDHLGDVLEGAVASMAFRTGGLGGLETARLSEEVATVELEGGLEVIGCVTSVRGHACEPSLVELGGRVALARSGRLLQEPTCDEGLRLPLGRLEDASQPSRLDGPGLSARVDADGRLRLRYAGGARVEGRPTHLEQAPARGLLELEDARVWAREGEAPACHRRYVLPLSGRVLGVRAGASDPAYWPEAALSQATVPERTTPRGRAAELLSLYERAQAAHAGGAVGRVFEEVHGALQQRFAREWLLRWNLLESLGRRPGKHPLQQVLVQELRDLERAYEGEHPIASGLRYLGYDVTGA